MFIRTRKKRAPVLRALCLLISYMSKVQYFNHKTVKAIFEAPELDVFIRREVNSGVLLLRDCVRERGKNQSKTTIKTYHVDFTFDEITDSLENEIPKSGSNFIITNEQAEAPQINASFSTPYEREQFLKSTFKLIESNET